jgi:hypothetical protein
LDRAASRDPKDLRVPRVTRVCRALKDLLEPQDRRELLETKVRLALPEQRDHPATLDSPDQ